MCICSTLAEPCKRCVAAAHVKQVWDQVQRRVIQTKINGLERALRVEHMPVKAKSIRNEINSLKAQLG